jgi:antitoxin MazE
MQVTRVHRWGNSLGLKIPARMTRALRLEHGSEVRLRYEKGRIVIEPVRAVVTLERLLAGVTPENRHHDLDWRPADDDGGP